MSSHSLLDQFHSWLNSVPSFGASKEIFWTLALLAFASLAARVQFKRIFSRSGQSLEDRRQARANFRNALIFATLGMLGFVWGGELQSMLLSLAAIAAALLIVSKELISCFYGALVFNLSAPARIGDAIEVGAHKGELLDHNWLSLTLLEISETHLYSGRVVKIPSSALLTTPLINLSQGGPYRFATIIFHTRPEHASSALALVESAAQQVCGVWTDDARVVLDAMRSARLAQMPEVDALATLVSVDKDSVAINLRFVAPAAQRASAQSSISRIFYQGYEAHLKKDKALEADRSHERSLALALRHHQTTEPLASPGTLP